MMVVLCLLVVDLGKPLSRVRTNLRRDGASLLLFLASEVERVFVAVAKALQKWDFSQKHGPSTFQG